MSDTECLDQIIVDEEAEQSRRWDQAAQLLEQARDAGCQDDGSLYLLALAYKRQGKLAEAQKALRQIAQPDAHAHLQLGLLALRENNLTQAEQEFGRALQLDPALFPAGYNLLLTRLSLGRLKPGSDLAARLMELAPSEEQRRRLDVLRALLASCGQRNAEGTCDPLLTQLSADEEEALIELVRSLGRLEIILDMLHVLAAARPMSGRTQEAYVEATIARAKQLLGRCEWVEAEQSLRSLSRDLGLSKNIQVILLNLLGCCACLNQDSDKGLEYFREAARLSPNDARLHQNIALALELQNRITEAEPHWNRYFDLLDDRLPAPLGQIEYFMEVAYQGLCRLANRFAEKEKWASAIPYQQRALRVRPRDNDAMERMFNLYAHAKRPEDARRVLRQLQEMRPGEPQYQLYELDLIEVNGLKDIESLLGEIERVYKLYPNDARVDDKAASTLGNAIPVIRGLCDQYTEQLNRVLGQVRRLPNYQINWSAVYDVTADLQRDFHKLRRITSRCLPLLRYEEQRRIVRNLTEHIDRKIEVCRSIRA